MVRKRVHRVPTSMFQDAILRILAKPAESDMTRVFDRWLGFGSVG